VSVAKRLGLGFHASEGQLKRVGGPWRSTCSYWLSGVEMSSRVFTMLCNMQLSDGEYLNSQ